MTIRYLDTSAWVKMYYSEKGTPWVRNLFDQGERFACASLGVVELTATLARKVKAGAIDPASLPELLESVEEHWSSFIQVDLLAQVLEEARALAKSRALRGGDAVHLASAKMVRMGLDGTGDDIEVVTSDAELINAATAEGFKVVNPENA